MSFIYFFVSEKACPHEVNLKIKGTISTRARESALRNINHHPRDPGRVTKGVCEVLEIIHIKQTLVVVKRIYLTLVSASATWSWLLYRWNKPVELDSYAFIITLI